MAKTPYLIQQGKTWWFSRAVPRPLQQRIGKKLWRINLGHDLAEARKELSHCLSQTDQEIELAKPPTEEKRRAMRQELLHMELQGSSAQDVWDHPRFYGTPKEAEALAELPKTSGRTPEEIIALVVALKRPAEGTVKEYKNSLRKFAKHYGSELILGASREDVTAFRDSLLGTCKTSTAKKVVRCLQGLWEVCCDEDWIENNPWKGILKHVRDEAPSEAKQISDDVWSKINGMQSRQKALFWLVAYSGMRIQEALGLRGEDLDLKQGVIRIASHPLRGIGNGIKNTSSLRAIPIDERLKPWAEQIATTNELVFPEYLSATGNWNTPSFWQQRLKCSPHKLRHAVATQLRASDVNEQTISDLLGHSPRTTTGAYGETTIEAMHKALSKLSWPLVGMQDQ